LFDHSHFEATVGYANARLVFVRGLEPKDAHVVLEAPWARRVLELALHLEEVLRLSAAQSIIEVHGADDI
jgi:hypothetical protein